MVNGEGVGGDHDHHRDVERQKAETKTRSCFTNI